MGWLPMKSHEATDEQVGAIFGRFRQCLVQQQRIANRAIEYAVKNVCEGFALLRLALCINLAECLGPYDKILRFFDHLPSEVLLILAFKDPQDLC